MNNIKFYLEKYKAFLIIGVIFIVALIIIVLKLSSNKSDNIEVTSTLSSSIMQPEKIEEKKEEEYEKSNVIVDIKGYVANPGVYELSSDKRIIDVINMAGGLLEDANTDYINLSKKVTDEMIIVIYSNNEVEKYKKTSDKIIYIEYECVCPDNINDACITDKDTVNTTTNSESTKNELDSEDIKDNKISINTATVNELMTLNGIGESKAKAIIKYREENGPFEKIEDIKNVSGIGDSAYEKIKDYIKL